MQCVSLLAVLSCLASIAATTAVPAPSVNIKNGTVVGRSINGVDSFLGVPFALPPTSNLRLRLPHTYNKTFDSLQATRYAPSCIGSTASTNYTLVPNQTLAIAESYMLPPANTTYSEDCLYLNVQRPSTARYGSKLPVVIYIYGGGFTSGTTSQFDASTIISRGSSLGTPFIYVSMAYRLLGYGFLGGSEVQKEGISNIGLHDQRKAMQWVQENIAAFGGDPDHVVIWGESSGSEAVFDHTVINGGDNMYNGRPLFHGAIMNSGSLLPSQDVDSPRPQAVYNQLVNATGCTNSSDTLSCLRNLSTEAFTSAALKGSYVPRPDRSNNFFPESAEKLLAQKKFAHVPVIVGDLEDEGTIFTLSQSFLATDNELLSYANETIFAGNPFPQIAEFVKSYPDDPAQGSPFNTGDQNVAYPEFKRLAAIAGDWTFTLQRRRYLSAVADEIPVWSYLHSYLHGLPILGTFHGADLSLLYGRTPSTYRNPQLPSDYFISFINYYDPNKLASRCNLSTAIVKWPQYKIRSRQLLHFGVSNTTTSTDNFRSQQYQALLAADLHN